MGLNAGTVWEIRTAGNSYNGGGYYDRGGASTDYSQQDGNELCKTDFATDVAGTELSTVGNNFTAAMVGNIVQLWTAGPGALIGFFEIIAFIDTGHVTLDRSAGSGLSNLYGNVGGAVSHPENIKSVIVAGNTVYIKSGTYNLTAMFMTTTATVADRILWIGYNSSRGDDPEPNSGNQPIIAAGANALYWQDYTFVKFIEFTTQASVGVAADMYVIMFKCKSTNTSGTAGYPGFSASNSKVTWIGCEGISTNGDGFRGGNFVGQRWLYCYAHDCGQFGIDASQDDQFAILFCISQNNEDGIYGGDFGVILHCTVNGNNDDGIQWNGGGIIFNNQLTNNGGHGVDNVQAMQTGIYLDYNNWYNNTGGDVDNVVKGPNATANDPGYTNAGAGDFSGVDVDDALVIELGVG